MTLAISILNIFPLQNLLKKQMFQNLNVTPQWQVYLSPIQRYKKMTPIKSWPIYLMFKVSKSIQGI